MIRLYSGSGSGEVILDGPAMAEPQWERLRAACAQLIRRRTANKDVIAAFESTAWKLVAAHNGFGDEFNVLLWEATMDEYVHASESANGSASRGVYETIASVVSEIIPDYIRFVVVTLDTREGPATVASPDLAITSDVVERALNDAQALITSSGATSGVDRVHTALHGYLRACADAVPLPYEPDADITSLVKVLIKGHSAFAQTTQDTDKVVRALAVIADALNPLRNHQSMAHANSTLLAEPEAMLVINTVRTLLHYFDAKTT